jgi:uncharacterized membrane protein (UPF0127 family)
MTFLNPSRLWGVSSAAFVYVWFLCASAAFAQPLIFERSDIRIEARDDLVAHETEALPRREPVTYSVEIRPQTALVLEYIHALNILTPETGVMIVMDTPEQIRLPLMKVYTPVDALFITREGVITQIAPNVTLGTLSDEIMSREPVQAVLFLKQGQAKVRALRPRDVVIGESFAQPPEIME